MHLYDYVHIPNNLWIHAQGIWQRLIFVAHCWITTFPLDNCMETFDQWLCLNFILCDGVSSLTRFIDIEFTPWFQTHFCLSVIGCGGNLTQFLQTYLVYVKLNDEEFMECPTLKLKKKKSFSNGSNNHPKILLTKNGLITFQAITLGAKTMFRLVTILPNSIN